MTFDESAFEAYALEIAREHKIPGLAVAAARGGITVRVETDGAVLVIDVDGVRLAARPVGADAFVVRPRGTDQYVRFLMDHSGRATAVAYGLRIIARAGSSEPPRSTVEDRAGRPV